MNKKTYCYELDGRFLAEFPDILTQVERYKPFFVGQKPYTVVDIELKDAQTMKITLTDTTTHD